MKTYAQKLLDPRWQRKRLEILEKADFTCCLCQATDETLHVHHTYYRKGADPWDYEGEDLMALCHQCHKEIEGLREDVCRMMNNEIALGVFGTLTRNGLLFYYHWLNYAVEGSDSPKSLRYRIEAAQRSIDFFQSKVDELKAKLPNED